MDVSPVRSSAKCGSDFSIERILSNESVSRSQTSEAPSWLCCTRYQPPRLPRTASSACRARRSGRHARVPFTAAQAAALEAAYARAPYLAPPALRALAAALQLRDDRIKIWFQNRRARDRREKSATIVPPREVALPPTSHFRSQTIIPTTADHTWSYKTGLHTSIPQFVHPATATEESLLRLNESINDCPRDLRVAATSTVLCPSSPKIEDLEYGRSETPLDVETIED